MLLKRAGVADSARWTYSIFGIAVDRKHTLKWLFPQKKPPFTALQKSICIPKVL